MQKSIQNIFSTIPLTYQRINHILTFGLDVLWRRKAAKLASQEGGDKWLDVCTGTGDMANLLSQFTQNGTLIFASDFCQPMIEQTNASKTAVLLTLTDTGTLPFKDNTFDLVTISFATRNINTNQHHLIQCFKEIYRILKLGGRFVNLETSQPTSWLFRKIFHLYVGLTVKRIGYLISGSKQAYGYLAQTIPRFHTADKLAELLQQAGFSRIDVTPLLLKAVAIHKATK